MTRIALLQQRVASNRKANVEQGVKALKTAARSHGRRMFLQHGRPDLYGC
jgi:hypothetical protein